MKLLEDFEYVKEKVYYNDYGLYLIHRKDLPMFCGTQVYEYNEFGDRTLLWQLSSRFSVDDIKKMLDKWEEIKNENRR